MRVSHHLGMAVLASGAFGFASAHAQDRPPHSHDDGGEIVVSAPLLTSEREVLSGTTIVSGETLERELRSTIGETLARQPGVSSTAFGPNASRPILRGFQGERVSVLSDGIGSIDVSNTSVDHAVVIDPLLAQRVEVLRGPAALLFGSAATGGVVNVIDKRIPRAVPEKGYSVDGMASYGSAAQDRSVAGSADVAVGPHFVINANGSYLKSDDLRIPGYAMSGPARAAALAAAAGPTDADDPDFAASAGIRRRLPNTAAETWTAGVGGAIVTDTANIGIAFSHYDSLYGVPIRYATESGQHEEAPRLSLVQNRIDVRADIATGGSFIERIRARAAYAAYRHYELEEDGEIGTTFKSRGLEGRLEFVQANRGGWSGASGVQYLSRDFDVAGEEAFLPNNLTERVGIFTLQQFDLGKLRFEGGARYERSTLQAGFDPEGRFFQGKRTFDAFSASAGASYELATDIRAGVNLSRTERAPSAEEVFARGEHHGTQSWELGDPDFRKEKGWTAEATFHLHRPGYALDASAYYSWFSNYIGENQVPDAVCEPFTVGDHAGHIHVPCFQFSQGKARYYGAEADMTALLGRVGAYAINLDLIGDYVRASGRDDNPLPRIPPARLLSGLEAQSDRLTGRVEVEHAFAQNRIAAFETRTDDYTLVNASISWKPISGNQRFSILLTGNNLFDVEARRAASVLKDFAPLAGRDIRVTARFGL